MGEDLALNKDIGWFNERFVSKPWTHAVLHLRLPEHAYCVENPWYPSNSYATWCISRGGPSPRKSQGLCAWKPDRCLRGFFCALNPVLPFNAPMVMRWTPGLSHPALMSAAHQSPQYQTLASRYVGFSGIPREDRSFLESWASLENIGDLSWSDVNGYNAVNERGSVSRDRRESGQTKRRRSGAQGLRMCSLGRQTTGAGLGTELTLQLL